MTDMVAHELGHVLGFAHYPQPEVVTCNPNSLMGALLCNPPLGELRQIDKDNYHNGYHADAVQNFQADNTAGPHMIRLTWDPSDIHNERAYLINWRNNCTGQWQVFATADKNTSSKTLINLQGGDQEFQILPLTNADPDHNFAGDTRNVTVDVVASLIAPSGLASTFPSPIVNRFEWTPVTGADHYKVLTDFTLFGLYAPSCAGAMGEITGTSHDAAVPPGGVLLSGVPYYRTVLACTAADLCSEPSNAFALSERFDQGAWDYAFTYYRSVDDINLDFINFNPNFMALQLHVRNGNTAGSPLVMSSACVIYFDVGAVGPMPASSFSSGNLAVQGHGVESTTTCAPTHANDSSSVGSDVIPTKAGFCCTTPVPPGVGGIAQVPSIDGPGDGAGTWALGVAAAAVALLLAAGALYAWRRRTAPR